MKKIFTICISLFLIHSVTVFGQVGIGTDTPDPSSVLDLTATDKGLLVPRLTTTQRTAIASPATALLVYDLTEKRYFVFNGTQWEGLGTPQGVIVMWSGSLSSIPEGWALCDGTNSTPDLRERFIVGAGSSDNSSVTGTSAYPVNNTGGANSVTLTPAQVPNHTHTMSSAGAHTHSLENFSRRGHPDGSADRTTNYYFINSTRDAANATTSLDMQSSGIHTHTINPTTGGGNSHENRPPFYALAFIIKL